MDKMDAKRRRDFVAALARVGNITLAAEQAKVSRFWAQRQRRADPAFRAETEVAIQAARARLREAEGSGPPGRWCTREGHELVIHHGHGHFVQVRRARRGQWTPRTEARFLAALGVTCNVRTALLAAGTSVASAYRHRRRWPDFARRWDEALEEGYDRLSTLIVANGAKMLGDEEVVPEMDLPDMTVAQVIQTLQLYRRQIHGDGRNGRKRGWWRRRRTLAEVQHSILTKLECVVRANEEEVARLQAEAAAREEWMAGLAR